MRTLARSRTAVLAAAALLLAASRPGRGEEPPPPEKPEAKAEEKGEAKAEARPKPFLDWVREGIESQVVRGSMWVDGFFGNPRIDETTRGTWGYVDVGAAWKNREGWSWPFRFRVRLSLPNAENRFSFFLGRESRDELVRGRTAQEGLPEVSRMFVEESRLLAAVGYSPPGTEKNKIDFRLGVDFQLPLNPFVQARWRHNEYLSEKTAILLRDILFLEYVERLGNTVGVDVEHILPGKNLLRSSSEGTVSGKRQGLEWTSTLTLYHPRSVHEVVNVSAGVNGATGGAVEVPEFGFTAARRRSVLREWLFVQGTAGYSWVRKDAGGPRRGTGQVGLTVQLQFGNPR